MNRGCNYLFLCLGLAHAPESWVWRVGAAPSDRSFTHPYPLASLELRNKGPGPKGCPIQRLPWMAMTGPRPPLPFSSFFFSFGDWLASGLGNIAKGRESLRDSVGQGRVWML